MVHEQRVKANVAELKLFYGSVCLIITHVEIQRKYNQAFRPHFRNLPREGMMNFIDC